VPETKLECEVKGDSTQIVVDELTGLRVTKRTTPEATVTTEMVKAILADFP
jgi:phosphatidylglycerophosphatase A